jgi:hypothetical protein
MALQRGGDFDLEIADDLPVAIATDRRLEQVRARPTGPPTALTTSSSRSTSRRCAR